MDVGTTSSRVKEAPPASQAGDPSPEPTPGESLKHVSSLLGSLGEYASYYVSAKLDRVKLSVRRMVLMAGLGIVGLLAGGAVVITAVALLVIGLAQAVAALLGGRIWAGNLIVSILLLAVVFGGAIVGMRMVNKSSRAQTIKKYENRQAKQRSDHGADVSDRAAAEGQVSR